MAAHPYVYSIEDLLAMAPPSYVHGVEGTHSPSSSPKTTSFHGPSTSSEPHQGWANLNAAMRTYLRTACPEIAMNRKMRKSIEFHHVQHVRAAQRPRSSSPNNRRPAEAPKSDDGFEVVQPHRRTPRTPPPAEATKRLRSPTARRSRPTNSRARHAHFTQLHLSANAAGDGDWRTVTRHGIVPAPPLPLVAVA